MGLTIHYKILTRRRLNNARVRELTEKLRNEAIRLGAAEVGQIYEVGPDYTWAHYFPPAPAKLADVKRPAEGWLCMVLPGEGSESFSVGLCRYEGVRDWQLCGFCKTQYAAEHGWEHFRKCHLLVVQVLRAAEALGLKLEVTDDGEYWETGSEKVLHEHLGTYDRLVAGMAGALKDALGDVTVEAPILRDPRFEQLEHEGRQENAAKIKQAAKAVARVVRR